MSVQEETERLTSPQTPPSESTGNGPKPTENVDRIREILFGPQMREYAQRLTRMEECVSRETGELKADVRRRLEALESYVRQEGTGLSERLQTERRERIESVDLLSRTHADSMKSLENTLGQINEQVSKDLRDLRQLTLARIKDLLDDITVQINASESVQKRHLEELRAASVDRFALASLLTEAASRVRNGSDVFALGEAHDGGAKP